MMYYFRHLMSRHAQVAVHWSMLEEGAYLRLATAYCTRLKALPLEREQVYRLARAKEKAEQRAVDTVLAEMFERDETGWHNANLDEQIENYRAVSEGGAHAAKTRWERHRASRIEAAPAMRSHSDGNSNNEEVASKPIAKSQSKKQTQSQPKAETMQSLPAAEERQPQPRAERKARSNQGQSKPVDAYPEEFRKFWKAAPRRKNIDLPETYAEYLKAVEFLGEEGGDAHAYLLEKMEIYADYEAHNDVIHKVHAKNWLAGLRWEDEYGVKRG